MSLVDHRSSRNGVETIPEVSLGNTVGSYLSMAGLGFPEDTP